MVEKFDRIWVRSRLRGRKRLFRSTEKRRRLRKRFVSIVCFVKFFWLIFQVFYGVFIEFLCCRGRRMRQHGYMRSLWSRFRMIVFRGQRRLLEEAQLIPMTNWRQILKVSETGDRLFMFCVFRGFLYFKVFYYVFAAHCGVNQWFFFYMDTLIKTWTFLFIHGWQVEIPKMGYLVPRRGVGKWMLLINQVTMLLW